MKLPFNPAGLISKLSYGDRPKPARDWFVLLSLATALVALSVAWNLWLMRDAERGALIGNEAPSTSFDAAPIESTRAVFEARKLEEFKFKQQYRFVDPSR